MSSAKPEALSNPVLVALIILIFVYFGLDYSLLTLNAPGPGWDFMSNCDASFAYAEGKNPYLAESYNLSRFLYTYPPVFLPFTHALCGLLHISKLRNISAYLPFLLANLALAVALALAIARAVEDAVLFVFVLVSAYGGMFWIMRSGNLSAFEVCSLTLALACLTRSIGPERGAKTTGYTFALLFGVFCGFKTVYAVLIPLFIVLPAPARVKARWALLSITLALLPALLSVAFYRDYVELQIANVVADQSLCSPSLYCMATHLSGRSPQQFVVMAWTVAMVGGSLALLGRYALRTPLLRLWRGVFFVDQRQGLRVFLLLLMIGIGLFPRMKEYSYGLEAACLSFYVVTDGEGKRLRLAAVAAAALPLLALHPSLREKSLLTFWAQLATLWTSIFALMLAEYRPFLALSRTSAPAEASQTATEGFSRS